MSESNREKLSAQEIGERSEAVGDYNRHSRKYNPNAPIDGNHGKAKHFQEVESRGLKLEALGLQNLTIAERQRVENFFSKITALLTEVASWPKNMYHCMGDGGADWQVKKDKFRMLALMVDNLAILLNGKISDQSNLNEYIEVVRALVRDTEAVEVYEEKVKAGMPRKGNILATFSYEIEIQKINQFMDLVKKDLGW
jgi:hypothetical protein